MTRYTQRTGTINTTTSRKTSKNKRREERKRARGKKGSVYEEEYLVNSIERLMIRVNGMNEEVGRLVEGLTKRRMRERAMAVEGSMREVLGLCEGCVGEVFGGKGDDKEKEVGKGEGEGEQELRPSGGDAVLWASLEEGSRKRDPPVLTSFKGLSLLG